MDKFSDESVVMIRDGVLVVAFLAFLYKAVKVIGKR